MYKASLIILVCSLSLFSCSEKNYEDLAYTQYQKKKLIVIEDLNGKIEKQPENAEIYLQRGRAKLFSAIVELEKTAIHDLNQAIKLDPELLKAYFVRAYYYKVYGTTEQQYNDLQTAIEIEPESASAYYKIGMFHRSQKDDPNAINSFKQAVKYDPKMHGGYYLQGLIYKNQGKYKKAIDLFTQSLQVKPNWAVYHYHRGEAYEEIGEIEKAIADYEQVLRYDAKQYGSMEGGAREHLKRLLATKSSQ